MKSVSINSGYFIFLSLYSISAAFLLGKALDERIYDLGILLNYSSMIIYFLLIFSFLVEFKGNWSNGFDNIRTIIIKVLLVSAIPFVYIGIISYKYNINGYELIGYYILIFFFVWLLWFLLIHCAYAYFHKFSFLLFVLLIIAPGITNVEALVSVELVLPFNLMIKCIQNIALGNENNYVIYPLLLAETIIIGLLYFYKAYK